jgi:hypothetical protein
MAGNFASASRALRGLFLNTSAKCVVLELHLGLDMALLFHNLGLFVLVGVTVLGLNRVIFTAPLMDAVASLIVGVTFIGLLFI